MRRELAIDTSARRGDPGRPPNAAVQSPPSTPRANRAAARRAPAGPGDSRYGPDVGLRDWFRSKPDEDPILGGLEREPTGLEAEASSATISSSVIAQGAEGLDPQELARRLQAAGSDPDQLVAQLREMFPGAQISVSESSVDSDTDPELAAQVLGSLGIGAPDPIAQLERLAALHASGALSDEEFAAAKARLLGT